uniref:Uncharacterized protein n=1 Tax=Fagus sylvatica TaxID=28930 RepID=A0A2N9H0N9_FAGSY
MWMSTESGIFEVTPYSNALRDSAGHYFPLKSIWGARVPRKVVEELAFLVKDNLPSKHLVLSVEEALVSFLQDDTRKGLFLSHENFPVLLLILRGSRD